MDEDPGWPAVATSKAIVGAETFLDSRYLSIVIHQIQEDLLNAQVAPVPWVNGEAGVSYEHQCRKCS